MIERCLHLIAALAVLTLPTGISAQAARDTTFDETIAPGANYDKAEFRLWYPTGAARVEGIVVLVPGSNGDGRSMVTDSVWRAFATQHRVALVGCRFTDKPHEQSFI
jgi:poly(3-hydroxybutyrate) depolymerase